MNNKFVYSFIFLALLSTFCNFAQRQDIQGEFMRKLSDYDSLKEIDWENIIRFIQGGANVNTTICGESLLHMIIRASEMTKKNYFTYIDQLIKLEADVNMQNWRRETPLVSLIYHSLDMPKPEDIAKLLIDKKATLDFEIYTVLHRAAVGYWCTYDLFKTVALACKKQKLLNKVEEETGKTALHYAVTNLMKGGSDRVKYLLDLGADANIKDLEERTPLDIIKAMREGLGPLKHKEADNIIKLLKAKTK